MREIKFRAWSKVAQQMVSWDEIKDKGNLLELINNPQYVLLQFTNLKDRNGAEIYEGDVLEYGRNKRRLIVEWDLDGGHWSELSQGDTCGCCYTGIDMLKDASFNCTNGRDCMIIGNVYQNPELLDK